jgi:hypothetical protein
MSKLLLAYRHYPVSIGGYFASAFERLGHQVTTIGPYSGDDGLITWPGYPRLFSHASRPDIIVSEAWQEYPLDEKAIKQWKIEGFSAFGKVLDDPYDAIISFDAGFRLSYQPSLDIPQAIYLTDPHARPYDCAANYPFRFSAQASANRPDLDTHWIPLGYDPIVHLNRHQPRDLDVAFIGVAEGPGYTERQRLIQVLRDAGISVTTGVLDPTESNNLYNRAKIAFNCSSSWDIPMRVFEGMAAGCCLVTNANEFLVALGFIEGLDYLGYRNDEELVAKVKGALDTGTWNIIRESGNAAVYPYSYGLSAMKMLDIMGVG